MAKKTDPTPESKKPRPSSTPHDDLAAKRQELVDKLAALDEEIAEAAEAARTGEIK